MPNDFDPYDALINLSERMHNLEQIHNKMAHAFHQSEHELTLALQSLKALQQRHLLLMNRIDKLEKDQLHDVK